MDSLNWILVNDITNVIDSTFSVDHEAFGVIRVHELEPGGKSIQVVPMQGCFSLTIADNDKLLLRLSPISYHLTGLVAELGKGCCWYPP